MNKKAEKCPVCNKNELLGEGQNALSRKSDLEICSECAQKEALEEFKKIMEEV